MKTPSCLLQISLDFGMLKVFPTNGPLIIAMCQNIPEFTPPLPSLEKFRERTQNQIALSLVATVNDKNAGFKVGYGQRPVFYSWLGGVIPKYRKLGIAKYLANVQEDWALQNGFNIIQFKTRNRHKAMLQFALKNGFDIIDFTQKADIQENRILLQKNLI